MNNDSVCIDLGEKFTRIVDASFNKGSITLNAAGIQNTVSNFYSDDTEKSLTAQAELISKMFSDLKLTKRNVNIVVPDTYSYSQILDLALLNEKELLSVVKYQADQFIPIPLDEVVLDIEILTTDKQAKQNKVLIIACSKKQIEKAEKLFEMLSLIPVSLENEHSSIGRLFSEILQYKNDKNDNSYLIINFGYSSSSIYLIDAKSSLIMMTHTIKLGLDILIKEIKFNLEVTDSKALELLKTVGFENNASYDISKIVSNILRDFVNELSKFMISSKEKLGLRVEKMYLFNYSSYVLSFDKKLSELLQVPVDSLILKDYIKSNPITESFGIEMTSFIGAISGNLR